MKIYPYIFSLLTCIGIALPGYAQVDRNETLIRSALHGLEYEIKAGFSIGGTAPLPLPVEIRSIDGYNPTLAISIGGEVTKWIAVQKNFQVTYTKDICGKIIPPVRRLSLPTVKLQHTISRTT